jgi:hypothetical protein
LPAAAAAAATESYPQAGGSYSQPKPGRKKNRSAQSGHGAVCEHPLPPKIPSLLDSALLIDMAGGEPLWISLSLLDRLRGHRNSNLRRQWAVVKAACGRFGR